MAARKKKTSTSGAIVPIGGTAGVPDHYRKKYADRMAAQRTATPGSSGTTFIRGSGGLFELPGGADPVETFDCVVLAAIPTRSYYAEAYKPGSTNPPDCVAVGKPGRPESELVPHADSQDVQAGSCAGCFVASDCSGGLALAIVSPDELDKPEEASIAVLILTSTGITPFGNVRDFLEERNCPTFGAVLQVLQEQPKNTYWTTLTVPKGFLNEETTDALEKRVDEAYALLQKACAPRRLDPEEAADTPNPRRKTSKKKAGKKKATAKKMPRRKTTRKKTGTNRL